MILQGPVIVHQDWRSKIILGGQGKFYLYHHRLYIYTQFAVNCAVSCTSEKPKDDWPTGWLNICALSPSICPDYQSPHISTCRTTPPHHFEACVLFSGFHSHEVRKEQEERLIHRIGCLHPNGMNVSFRSFPMNWLICHLFTCTSFVPAIFLLPFLFFSSFSLSLSSFLSFFLFSSLPCILLSARWLSPPLRNERFVQILPH